MNLTKTVAWMVGAALSASAILPCPSAAAEDVVTPTRYLLQNVETGRFLTVSNAEAAEGTALCLYQADGAADYNTWHITEQDGQNFTLYTALSDRYGVTSDADGVQRLSQTPQQQVLTPNADGTYTIYAGEKRLTAEDNTDGAMVTMQLPTDSPAQKWYLHPASGYTAGDADRNGNVNILDLQQLKQILCNEAKPDMFVKAHCDVNRDGILTASDAAEVQAYLLNRNAFSAAETSLPECTIFPTVTKPDTSNPSDERIPASVQKLNPSMPSTGTVRIPIFAIDFPDCTFETAMTEAEIEQVAFGEENPNSIYYPTESLSAYFDRSSGGALQITGDAYCYTAKQNISAYSTDKSILVKEVLEAFDDSVDFSIYDADEDGMLDASIYCVPGTADSNDWWPVSGGFADPYYTIDGITIGNIMTGNDPPSSHGSFNSTWVHEMGHAMGLPDYYKYNTTDDFEGMHGDAGFERMDEAIGDFGAFSKLMLGWYCKNNVQIFDAEQGTQTFSVGSSEELGSMVLIPCGELDGEYFSEYLLIESITKEKNNSSCWFETGGIRILHVDATLYHDEYWDYYIFANENYSPVYQGDDKERILRLVNDGGGFFTTGDVITGETSGFAWYDENGYETVDPGVTVTIGEQNNGTYSVTISATE